MNTDRMKTMMQTVITFVCAAAIPALLIIDGLQTRRYETLEHEVNALEKKQIELVEENKTLVTNISMLSNSNRIEKIAESQLNMHKAESDEIVRVEMKGAKK